MDAALVWILEHDLEGLVVLLASALVFVFWRYQRDLKEERDFWRDRALRALSIGEKAAGIQGGSEADAPPGP